MRDASGLVQVTCVPADQPEAAAVGERVRQEWVVAVTGVTRRRQVPNLNIPTGMCASGAQKMHKNILGKRVRSGWWR